jgi:hypothetical protein
MFRLAQRFAPTRPTERPFAAGPPARPHPRPMGATTAALVAAALLAGCDRLPDVPLVGTTATEAEPFAATRGTQPPAPVDALRVHLDGFQFRNGDLASQHRIHHFCAELKDEVLQCALFDGTGKDARLTGVEYVISERLFAGLPDEEKPYWHSQVHQVKAGTLIAPALSEDADHALAGRLVKTYAKTWQLWPVARHGDVPLGVPQLMMGFTQEGQLDPVLLAERDRQIGVATAEKRRNRADIPTVPVAPGADAWQQGRIAQVQGAVDSTKRAP